MRIGVVSDSHGNLYMLDKALSSMGNIDMIIHLGDCIKDIIKINDKYKKQIEYVWGNNDWSANGIYEKALDICGKKIFITHGHRYSVSYDIESLYDKALEIGADAVLYGHTHRQIWYKGDMIILNPGSITFPRDQGSGAAVMTIDENGIDVNLFRIEI